MHYNYKSGEKVLKTLILRNILSTDPNKKNKTYIYPIINSKPPT